MKNAETTQIMLDATPFGTHFWDENCKMIDCNQAALNLFKLSDKQELINNFSAFSPEYQPDGGLSAETAIQSLKKAFKEGYLRKEWMHQTIDGELIPCEVTLVRVDIRDDRIVASYIRDLREQKRMMQELGETAAQLKAVVSNYPGAICSSDKNHRVNLFDGLLVPHLVTKDLFFEGQDLNVALQSDDLKHIMEKLNRTFTEGSQDWTFEARGKFLHMTTTPIFDDKNEVVSLVAKIDDISETMRIQRELQAALEKAETAIRASEAAKSTASAMFDANPHINILFDSSLKIIDCNPAAIKFFGFETKEDLLAGLIERMVKSIPSHQPDGRVSIPLPERLMYAIKNGSVKFETELHLRGTKQNLDVEFKKIPYGDSFVIVGYVFDMTNIHEREMELARAQKINKEQLTELNLALEKAEAAIRASEAAQSTTATMFEANPQINILFNNRLQVIDCNPEAVKFMGVKTKEDLLKGFVGFMQKNLLTVLSDGRVTIPIGERLMIVAKHGDDKFDTEIYIDGKIRKINVEFKRIPYGDSFAIVAYVNDMTEIREREAELIRHQKLLNDAVKEAEAANKAKSAFLSTMSHEIRTPMNAIIGITEILLQDDNLNQNTKEALGKVYSSGDLLLGIINDILDLSKIEAGKLELVQAKYEIASLINDTATLNMMRIGSKPIEFELFVDENTPSALIGDELRIKQVLNNLLSNAFKYTDKGRVTLSVSAETAGGSDEDVTLILKVSDTGQGMTKGQIAQLFDEYARFNMETNRTTEGTGLGMSITQNLIRLMNGEIFIESEPGKGSTFTIHIPQNKNGFALLGKKMAENLCKFRTSGRAQMKRVQITREPMSYGSVLIVDDVETNIYVAKGILSPYDLKIDSSNSGFAAIDKIKNGNVYDIVFMDHMMPIMDGIETTKIIRDMGYDRPIVALTANAVSGQADIFLENGFDDFISKPIDVRQLNAVLNKLIRDKQPPEVIEAARKQAGVKSSDTERQSGVDMRFAEVFARDALKALATLEAVAEKNDYCNEDNMRTYIINVHGMKSALANIGNMDLSAVALKLEAAGRDGMLETITSETPAFLNLLRVFTEEIAPQKQAAADETADEDRPYLLEKLLLVKSACEEYDKNPAHEALTELCKTAWSQQTEELLGAISEHLLHSDFDEIVEKINGFIETR